ncbi:TPM domain-containing protein [Parapedobacter sp.]
MRDLSYHWLWAVCTIGCWLLAGLTEVTTAQYRVSTIPSPKESGQHDYVSNPDGILGAAAVDSLNRLAYAVDHRTSAELAVVVVDDFVGGDDFQFALELFNTWGIGKDGADNGLLLFVATEKRAYRFITGYGMEAVLPDALLKRIGEGLLVPRFREGDYDGGVLAGMAAVKEVVLDPASAEDLSARMVREASWFYRYRYTLLGLVVAGVGYYFLWRQASRAYNRIRTKRGRKKNRKSNSRYLYYSGFVLFFAAFLSIFAIAFFEMPPTWLYSWSHLPWYVILFFGLAIWMVYVAGLREIRANRRDVAHRREAVRAFHRQLALPLLATPLLWISFFFAFKRRRKERIRLVPPPGSGWQRVDREQNPDGRPFLDDGQRDEEKAGARAYEIWTREGSKEGRVIPFDGERARKFMTCPSCGYFAFTKPFVKTITRATTKRAGQGERMQYCHHCNHKLSLGMVVLPKISSSSGTSGSGSSSGGSGSSGGSWGGGSSGGGGAGGRW